MSNVVVSELKRPKVDFSGWDPGMVARHESVLKNDDSPVAKAQHSPPVQQPNVPVTPAERAVFDQVDEKLADSMEIAGNYGSLKDLTALELLQLLLDCECVSKHVMEGCGGHEDVFAGHSFFEVAID